MNATAAITRRAPRRSEPRPAPWLFSAPVDLAAFLGSAVASLAALWWGASQGLLESGTPQWAWVGMILLVDVAHVYATGFRVYFDQEELARRPLLYAGVPLGCLFVAAVVYSEGEQLFWRCLAYAAVFHFVRQQYGWVALYRRRAGDCERWTLRIDQAAIYLATVYPLIWWHCQLPREFSWFRPDDFLTLPAWLAALAAPLYWAALAAYFGKAVWLWRQGRPNWGKDIVVATTAVCWHIGIIVFNSDYAFTVTNVLIHGVPYIVLVGWHMQSRARQRKALLEKLPQEPLDVPLGAPVEAPDRRHSVWRTAVVLLSTIWLLAYVEELLWDRSVWHERPWLFGGAADEAGPDGAWRAALAPLLAVPQLTHYVLDGFIWRRKSNPNFTLPGEGPTASPIDFRESEWMNQPDHSGASSPAAAGAEPPRSVGQHVLADLYGVDAEWLRDEPRLMALFSRLLRDHGFEILSSHSFKFPGPGGVTGFCLLSESHAAFHSYPEYRYLAADVFSCGAAPPLPVLNDLARELGAGEVRLTDHLRGGRDS